MKSTMLWSTSLCGVLVAAVVLTFASAGTAAERRVLNVAGGYLGDGGPATNASFALASGVVRDAKGNLYVSDALDCRIRRVSASGLITTFAGTGICGHSGDGGPAREARIANVYSLAFDKHGNLLIGDIDVVRSITPGGIISTIAGNGRQGYSGDGGPATKATFSAIYGMTVDSSGNIFIVDGNNNVVRQIDTNGIVRTVAAITLADSAATVVLQRRRALIFLGAWRSMPAVMCMSRTITTTGFECSAWGARSERSLGTAKLEIQEAAVRLRMPQLVQMLACTLPQAAYTSEV